METRSPFYNMYLNMWIMGTVTEAQLRPRVPRFISEVEFEMIIATPQSGVIPVDLMSKQAETE